MVADAHGDIGRPPMASERIQQAAVRARYDQRILVKYRITDEVRRRVGFGEFLGGAVQFLLQDGKQKIRVLFQGWFADPVHAGRRQADDQDQLKGKLQGRTLHFEASLKESRRRSPASPDDAPEKSKYMSARDYAPKGEPQQMEFARARGGRTTREVRKSSAGSIGAQHRFQVTDQLRAVPVLRPDDLPGDVPAGQSDRFPGTGT